jgi:SAM-dependent methyltransferase
VGCGGGATVIELARRVGPTGHVLGVDISEMLAAHARDRIAAERLLNAELQVADAASAQLVSADADLLFSRFGVMFFSQPDAAFTHLRRAMRPGGRLLFVAWRSRQENAWVTVPLEAGNPFLPPEPKAEPGAPGPYAFADAKRVQAILLAGGWQDISIASHEAPVRLSKAGDLDGAVAFATRIGPLSRRLSDIEPVTRSRIEQAVKDALRPFDGADGVTLTGTFWIVSARA